MYLSYPEKALGIYKFVLGLRIEGYRRKLSVVSIYSVPVQLEMEEAFSR
jgi:hypothetical protein